MGNDLKLPDFLFLGNVMIAFLLYLVMRIYGAYLHQQEKRRMSSRIEVIEYELPDHVEPILAASIYSPRSYNRGCLGQLFYTPNEHSKRSQWYVAIDKLLREYCVIANRKQFGKLGEKVQEKYLKICDDLYIPVAAAVAADGLAMRVVKQETSNGGNSLNLDSKALISTERQGANKLTAFLWVLRFSAFPVLTIIILVLWFFLGDDGGRTLHNLGTSLDLYLKSSAGAILFACLGSAALGRTLTMKYFDYELPRHERGGDTSRDRGVYEIIRDYRQYLSNVERDNTNYDLRSETSRLPKTFGFELALGLQEPKEISSLLERLKPDLFKAIQKNSLQTKPPDVDQGYRIEERYSETMN
jgi:hypothetical protein